MPAPDTDSIFYTYTEARRIATTRQEEMALEAIAEAAVAHDRARRSVAEYADSFADRLRHVADKARRGVSVNSLGEVQGSGAAFDILCATYAATGETVARLAHQMVRIGVVTEEQVAALLAFAANPQAVA